MTIMSDIDASQFLPRKVTEVPRDTILSFQHSKKVGNYLLGKSIGEGSFAKVKEAMHVLTGEKVAIKVIDKRKAKEDSYIRKNLRREGKLLQLIRHPHVVQLLEIMETENSYYLVMEYCKGGDLMDYICQKKKLEEKEAKRFIRQVISAIDYLHRMGILHRDLKVENLLLDENRDIKIIDFGLSNKIKVVTTKDGIRAQELLATQCGSPAYAAPELLSRKRYGPQVDVWSIGVNMFAMLTGNLPFTVQPFNIKVLQNKMIAGQMNPVPDNISRDSRDLMRKFLTPDPDKRITLLEAMKHPWIAKGTNKQMDRSPCPNKRKSEELDENILKHMSTTYGFRLGEVIRLVTGNIPSPALSMYYNLEQKLQRHNSELRVKGKISALESYSQRSVDVFQTYPVRKQKSVPASPLPPTIKDQTRLFRERTNISGSVTRNIEKDLTLVEVDENANNVKETNPVRNENNIDTEGTIKTDIGQLKSVQKHKTVFNSNLSNHCTVTECETSVDENDTEERQKIELQKDSIPKSITSPKRTYKQNSKRKFRHTIDQSRKHVPSNSYMAFPGPKTSHNENKFHRIQPEEGRNKQFDLNGRFLRKTEVKFINNKKRIDLIYTATNKNDSENKHMCVSPNIVRFNSPIVEHTKLFLQSKLRNKTIKGIVTKDQHRDEKSFEEISVLSSQSKQLSSRCATELSSSVKESQIMLPCISPTNQFS